MKASAERVRQAAMDSPDVAILAAALAPKTDDERSEP